MSNPFAQTRVTLSAAPRRYSAQSEARQSNAKGPDSNAKGPNSTLNSNSNADSDIPDRPRGPKPGALTSKKSRSARPPQPPAPANSTLNPFASDIEPRYVNASKGVSPYVPETADYENCVDDYNPFADELAQSGILESPLVQRRTITAAMGTGNPFSNPFAEASPAGSDNEAEINAASEYYRTLADDSDADDNCYEEMLKVFMRENAMRPSTGVDDEIMLDGLYGGVSEIGGLPYRTAFPMSNMNKVIVSKDYDKQMAEDRLGNNPAGAFLLWRATGDNTIYLAMIDRQGCYHHKDIFVSKNEEGIKSYSIAPSVFRASSIEKLLIHFFTENGNDALPCHLTIFIPESESREAATPEDMHQYPHGAILTDIPKEFRSRQSSLLFSGDYDAPRCLRCGKRFTGIRAAKRLICHCCGVAVCSDCSSGRLTHSPNVRVCSVCYEANKDNTGIKTALRPVPVLVAAGNLTKSDKKKRSWLTRFFTLDSNGLLHYYKLKLEKRQRKSTTVRKDSGELLTDPSAETSDSSSTIGDVAGTVNIKDNCLRIEENPDIAEWPVTSSAAERFAVCTTERTFYFVAKNKVLARKWRGVLTLAAECCFGCGKRLYDHDHDEDCLAAMNEGLLYHKRCYFCVICHTKGLPTPKTIGTVSDTPLSLFGGDLFCDKHMSERKDSRATHEADETEIYHLRCSLFNHEGIKGYIDRQLRRYAEIAASVIESQEKEATDAISAGFDRGSMPIKDFGKISNDERAALMKRVNDGDVSIEQAVQEIRRNRASVFRGEAALAMCRCAAHGINVMIEQTTNPTELSESWNVQQDSVSAQWTVIKSDTWTATDVNRVGATPLHVTSYQPEMFEKIRRLSGIDDAQYANSFNPVLLDKTKMISGGSSGCWVVRTHDSKYIIKNCRGDEKETLMKILSSYTSYLEKNPRSLLCRYLGAYELRMGGGKSFVTVVMTNSMYNGYCAANNLRFHEVYDLKGSIVGRRSVKASMRGITESVENFSGTRKDMDLRRSLCLDPEDRNFVVQMMRSDAEFLKSLQLMDYSLIVAIHNCASKEAAAQHGLALASSSSESSNAAYLGGGSEKDKSSLYVFGIIDLLQKWGRTKVAESFAKSKVLGHDKHAISAVKPDEYAERFVRMLSGRFDDYLGVK